MTEFIQAYWQTALYTVLTVALTHSATMAKKAVSNFSCKQELIEEGMLALLHDRLFQACSHYIACGSISLSELNNLEQLYDKYHRLGGNGTGTEVYERCRKLKIQTDSSFGCSEMCCTKGQERSESKCS